VGEIEARLEDRFQLLAGGDPTKPTRHQTLRAAVDWSYELLAPPERALLRRLAVFGGSWTLAAAEAVCADPRPGAGDPLRVGQVLGTLGLLVSKSLVVAESATTPQRYRFLETLREYAAERLEGASEAEACRARHLQFYGRLVERAEPELTGREQGAWLRALDADYGNLRAALEWGAGAQPDAALALAASLGRYWQIRGYFREGREYLGRALAAVDAGAPHLGPVRARAQGWAAFLAVYQGEYAEARRLAEASATLCREHEDRAGRAAALGTLAIVAKDCGERDRSEALFTESLALSRAAGDGAGDASTLGYLGILAADRGNAAAARAYYEESLAIRRARGDRWGIAAASNNLGLLALDEGEPARARHLLREALSLRRDLGDRRCIAVSLNHLGRAALALGEIAEARACYAESLRVAWEIGDRRSIAYSLDAIAGLVLSQETSPDTVRCAVRLCAAAGALRGSIGAALSPLNRTRTDAMLATVREVLTGAEYDAAWAEGAALPLEESVSLALAGVEPDGSG
jgi:tetratricopeptide (TPR) repeat protein